MKTVQVGGVTFGAGKMKICVPVCAKTPEEALDAIQEIRTTPADLIEWRLDYFDEDILGTAPAVFAAAGTLPVLCTFRTKAEGGEREIAPGDYFALNEALGALGAKMLDLELALCEAHPEAARQTIAALHEKGAALVISSHDFEKTPPRRELVERYARMRALDADLPKIAVMPQSQRDVMMLLSAMTEASAGGAPLIGISMGEMGKVTRVRGGAFGSVMTFASKGKASAPGQIDAETLASML
ncbi:MAG: type I 3-dehydroquinate dehydratase [Hominenteromicrobium sp.]